LAALLVDIAPPAVFVRRARRLQRRVWSAVHNFNKAAINRRLEVVVRMAVLEER
jgi:hypothetical protein